MKKLIIAVLLSVGIVTCAYAALTQNQLNNVNTQNDITQMINEIKMHNRQIMYLKAMVDADISILKTRGFTTVNAMNWTNIDTVVIPNWTTTGYGQ